MEERKLRLGGGPRHEHAGRTGKAVEHLAVGVIGVDPLAPALVLVEVVGGAYSRPRSARRAGATNCTSSTGTRREIGR